MSGEFIWVVKSRSMGEENTATGVGAGDGDDFVSNDDVIDFVVVGTGCGNTSADTFVGVVVAIAIAKAEDVCVEFCSILLPRPWASRL